MAIVCAWCGHIIKAGNEEVVSHGICDNCKREQEQMLANMKRKENGFK